MIKLKQILSEIYNKDILEGCIISPKNEIINVEFNKHHDFFKKIVPKLMGYQSYDEYISDEKNNQGNVMYDGLFLGYIRIDFNYQNNEFDIMCWDLNKKNTKTKIEDFLINNIKKWKTCFIGIENGSMPDRNEFTIEEFKQNDFKIK